MNRPVRPSTRRVLSRGLPTLWLIGGLLIVAGAPTPAPVAATGNVSLSPPEVQGTLVPGADLENFNSMPISNTTSAVLGVGTVTGGSLSTFSAGQYGTARSAAPTSA